VARRVVCISRTTGGGGEAVGRLVAERLGFRYLDDEIVAQAAQKGGLDAAAVADAERRRSTMERFLEELDEAGGAETGGYAGFVSWHDLNVLTTEDVRALIRDAVAEAAAQGEVVIVAHAASHLLGARDEVLRVLVTASDETRVRRVAEAGGLDAKAAAKALKDSDAARADYLKRFYGVKAELTTHYDLVVNTDALTPEEAAAAVAQAASR